MSFIDDELPNVTWTDWYEEHGVTRRGKLHLCPFHDDKNPSFSIRGPGWKCFSGCGEGDAVTYIAHREGVSEAEAIEKLRTEFKIEKKAGKAKPRMKPQITATYSYNDMGGKPWLRKLRREPGESDRPKDFLWEHFDGAAWKPGQAGREQPLYRLSEIVAAGSEEPIFITEGEKAADKLAGLGVPVTTSGGADTWKPHHAEQFPEGRDVAILRDNDSPGLTYSETVAAALATKSRSVRVVLLPGLPEKGDPWDFVESGGTADDILAAVANTPAWKPQSDIDGAAILARVESFIRRYCVLSPAQLHVLGLWVFHTWAIEAAETTPYIAVTSPEKQAGKTRVLEVLDLLVNGAFRIVTPSEAVIFRRITMGATTVLLDEVDGIFSKPQKETEGLRAILNAGYRRGATIPRINIDKPGKDKLEMFESFCPKAFSGIGTLPETLADRSIQVRMKRRIDGEEIERFRMRAAVADATPLRDEVAKWAAPRIEKLTAARPVEIGGISDRMEDGAEPLVAIAEMMGAGMRARTALLQLCTSEAAADQSLETRLLEDIRQILGERSTIPTQDLCLALCKIESSPWAGWRHGYGLKAYDVAKALNPTELRLARSETTRGRTCAGTAATTSRKPGAAT